MTDAFGAGIAGDSSQYFPELVLCMCAAVGTDTREVSDAFASELRSVGYTPIPIRLSSLMAEIPGLEFLAQITAEDERIRKSMHAGNEIRRIIDHADAMARIALSAIHTHRGVNPDGSDRDAEVPLERHCFIVSSLKRAEELETLRRLFGQRVLLASIFEPKDRRRENLCKNIARSKNSSDPDTFHKIADDLIRIDQKEQSNHFGQRLEDVFQKADVFLKAGPALRADVRRFIQLLFRAPFVTPTVEESLMFQARATAKRSADLSRQVGAVIATSSGEILATGCNEVPRAGGGIKWDDVAGTDKDYRDYQVGQDAAAASKKEIVAELLALLAAHGWLTEDKAALEDEERANKALYDKENTSPLAKAAVANLLEFGRIVHAEMAAICDAAMRGVSIKGATLFCTTFPCHMCARHIVAAGVARVIYIEPYPKSRAKKLYKRAIQVDHDTTADHDAVTFEAFVGVAPTRFLDLFEMVERKDEQGYALQISAGEDNTPKGVSSGSSAVLESQYVASINNADWSQLTIDTGVNGGNEQQTTDTANRNHESGE